MIEPGAITATRKEVRRFGLLFGGICAAVAVFLSYKGAGLWPWFAIGGSFFVVAGMIGYRILRPVYIGWMKFASVLGWINTRLLLGVFFYLVLTPIGLLMKFFNNDLLDEKIQPGATSYWKKCKTPADAKKMERQF